MICDAKNWRKASPRQQHFRLFRCGPREGCRVWRGHAPRTGQIHHNKLCGKEYSIWAGQSVKISVISPSERVAVRWWTIAARRKKASSCNEREKAECACLPPPPQKKLLCDRHCQVRAARRDHPKLLFRRSHKSAADQKTVHCLQGPHSHMRVESRAITCTLLRHRRRSQKFNAAVSLLTLNYATWT